MELLGIILLCKFVGGLKGFFVGRGLAISRNFMVLILLLVRR